jgi:hypothetical protein
MIGNKYNPAYAYERNAGGESGPRGCDPLAWSPRSRIARAQPDWFSPVVAQFTLSGTPLKVASLDSSRAVISFAGRITQVVQQGGGIILSPSERDCANNRFTICLPAVYLAAGSPQPVVFHACKQYSYERDGALVNAEWWAKLLDAPASGALTVTTWTYYG